MALKSPLKRFKFTYQTEFSPEHDYKKVLYASTSLSAWTKFNNYCHEHNIKIHDAFFELMEAP